MKNIKKIYEGLVQMQKERSLFKTHLPELNSLIKNNNVEKVKEIIDRGLNINSKDKNSKTLLHFACESNHPEMIEMLLTYKPKTYCPDQWQRTPLTILGETKIKELKTDDEKEEAKLKTVKGAMHLIEYGMPFNERDKLDRTAFIWCAMNDNELLGAYLLTHPQTDIKMADIGGLDALLNSFYQSSDKFFKMLTHSARNSDELNYCIAYTRVAKGADSIEASELEGLRLVTKLEEVLPQKGKTKLAKI